jgi:hypothetical protein
MGQRANFEEVTPEKTFQGICAGNLQLKPVGWWKTFPEYFAKTVSPNWIAGLTFKVLKIWI